MVPRAISWGKYYIFTRISLHLLMAIQKPVLNLENFTKNYGETLAVDDLDLFVNEDEFLTLLGPSGCGKTTTLRCIAGLESVSEGQIKINGRDQTGIPPYNRPTSTAFQSYALFPHKTVGENIGFGLKMAGKSKEKIAERTADMLSLVELDGFENRNISELSGGQKQRVALARALITQPEVLLLDEPLGALDLQLRENMQIELKQIQDELGITFIYVTHDQEEALTMSDKVAVMNDGHIEQIGSPTEIYSNPSNLFVADFIGNTNLLTGTYRVSKSDSHIYFSENVAVPVRNLELNDGASFTVSIRPEQITIGTSRPETGDQEAMLQGEVNQIIFKGNNAHLYVEVDGHELLVERPMRNAQLDVSEADHCFLTWEQEQMNVFRN